MKSKQLFGQQRSLLCDLLPMLYHGAAADVLPNFPSEMIPAQKKKTTKLKSLVDLGEITCFRLLLWENVDVEEIRIKTAKGSDSEK